MTLPPQEPRYGEYAPGGYTPPAQPAQPAPYQPAYGQAPGYPSQDRPPGYGNAPYGYAQPNPYAQAPVPAKPKGLGLSAFIASLVLIIGSLIASVVLGAAFAPLYLLGMDPTGGFDTQNLPASSEDQAGVLGLGIVAHIAVGSIVGIVVIILGILAIVQKRGRLFGILGLCIAVIAPIVSVVVFYVTIFATAPGITS